MSAKPILILQMQRMGDLILSFPLFLWLQREHPGHPIWVVGEPRFYEALLPVSPAATYFPWTATEQIRQTAFTLCVNLSHERAAAALAGEVRAERRVGPVQSTSGVRRIHGPWHLYRAGLVHANRHNRFHWADLNALDCVPLSRIAATRWPEPRTCLGDRRRIGLFLGASEPAKRPTPRFWADLARELLHRDLRPILLGGPAERDMAAKVQKQIGHSVLNLADRLTLAQLADLGQSLELLVTPDTGPMHLAAWTGLRVLNLSLGPVNPWETGPYQPGHHVLQARISCAGCWGCTHPKHPGAHHEARHATHRCHDHFLPRRVAQLVHALADPDGRGEARPRTANGNLFLSAKTPQGLYRLNRLLPESATRSSRNMLDEFWSMFWGSSFGLWERDKPLAAWTDLTRAFPDLAETFIRFLFGFHRKLRQASDETFWSQGPPMLRPLYSQAHLILQNDDFSWKSERQILTMTEELLRIVAGEKNL
ncbi:glycosyltransferase family 9 protein [Desulfonatronum sp. SC1]|uniref:glycosyltransferase family 9 protein n=1 Tax=Desulfonatronum sp. SC1 TaxID=2109626 RepID=UPI000D324A1C|nr:glycosyltransferase family 9 protein [Desulfonatronum sp. SC1]PTN36373.1 glycosyltransferase family 9 protein [Desulfonatronum sp. SC1]